MNLINKRFKTIEDLNSKIFEEILSIIKANNRSLFILSGGNSPRHLFKIISQNKKNFKEATFLMSDERLVNIEDQNSNEGEFIRLSNISKNNLISLHDKKIAHKLKDIKCPFLIIHGVKDEAITIDKAEAFSKRVPNLFKFLKINTFIIIK